MMEDKGVDEECNVVGNGSGGGGGGGGPTSSRWNPTKEQINVLESLYKQGMRTPTAEQIQQITSRLRVYGHIEGKNVFYWFQNHKARQRQKQKQECMLYFNHFLHKPVPNVFAPSPPHFNNVACSPYYMPQSSIGYYPQQHMKVSLPSGVMVPRKPVIDNKRNRSSDAKEDIIITDGVSTKVSNDNKCHETLPLFPLHPTGILKHRSSQSGNVNPSISTGHAGLDVVRGKDVGATDPSLIDFFGDCSSDESPKHILRS